MAETTYPGDSNTLAPEWPYVARPDGIIGDTSGGAFGITPSGSSTSVSISTGTASVAGFGYINDSAASLDPATVGTQPTTGQMRVDRVALVYDWSRATVDLDTAAQLEVIPGTPVSTAGNYKAYRPSLPRTIGTRYAIPLWWIARIAGGIVTAYGDERVWTGDRQVVGSDFDTTTALPIGSQIILPTGREYVRTRSAGGVVSWTAPQDYGGYAVVTAFGEFPGNGSWYRPLNLAKDLPAGTYLVIGDYNVQSISGGTINIFTRMNAGSGIEGGSWFSVPTSETMITRTSRLVHGGGTLEANMELLSNSGNYRVLAGSAINVIRLEG